MAIINNPLISIIVPIYNSEKYLERCIKSIISQTYNNIEIILVNDGSKDSSLLICKEFEKKDNRIIIIDLPNKGVSHARNQGTSIANGVYIQYIDSDDFVDNIYIETLCSTLQNKNVELVVCAIESFDIKGNKFDEWKVKENRLDFNNINKTLFLELIQKFLLFGPVNKLYKKEIITNNSILFDTSLSYGEDLLFNLEYFKHIDSLAITDKIAYKYIHDNTESLSKKRYANKTALAKRIHYALLTFFKRLELTDNESMSILYHRLFDHYYNEVFVIINDNKLTFIKKHKEIKVLLREKELGRSYAFLKTEKYASWIVFLMRYKCAFSFLTLNAILRITANNK